MLLLNSSSIRFSSGGFLCYAFSYNVYLVLHHAGRILFITVSPESLGKAPLGRCFIHGTDFMQNCESTFLGGHKFRHCLLLNFTFQKPFERVLIQENNNFGLIMLLTAECHSVLDVFLGEKWLIC